MRNTIIALFVAALCVLAAFTANARKPRARDRLDPKFPANMRATFVADDMQVVIRFE